MSPAKKPAVKSRLAKTATKTKAKPKPAKPGLARRPRPKSSAKPSAKPSAKKLKPSSKPAARIQNTPKGAIAVSEIEILRKDLDKAIGGRRIKNVEVLNPKVLNSSMKPAEIKEALVGREISLVARHGMFIFLEFLKGAGGIAILLGEGGQLRHQPTSQAKADAVSFILTFTQGGQLRINNHRKDVKIVILNSENQNEELKKMRSTGIDLIETPIPWSFFLGRLRMEPQEQTIKELLLNQNFIVGLGDIYSDEILYKSRLKFNTQLKDVSDQKVILLLQAAVEILYEAIKFRGTTLAGGYFSDLEGNSGEFQNHLNVYGRDGELTPLTLHKVEKKRFQNRWTYYCPTIQI